MSTGREVTTASREAAQSPNPTTSPHLALNAAALFTPRSLETKQSLRDSFTLLPRGLLEDVISSFLVYNDKVKLSGLSIILKKRIANSPLFKQALLKELLCKLVGAFQTSKPQYPMHYSFILENNTRKLTETNSVERNLVWAVSAPLLETDEAQYQALQQALLDPHKCALVKAILLELIKSHQYPKAQALLKNFPPFLSRSEDRLDYLFALMVSGYQDAAEAWIDLYPELLMQKGKVVAQGEVYRNITPYQYTLCLKYTQMRLMIREKLADGDAALQAKEYEGGQNAEMNALKQKYSMLMKKTISAYQYFCMSYSSWTPHQIRDYASRVIGGLQKEWPVPWMQELFHRDRAFNLQTNFSSEDALKSLIEAVSIDNVKFYPWDQGYRWARFYLKSYPSDVKISEESLLRDRMIIEGGNANYFTATLQLIQQGNDYFIYAPMMTDNIENAVQWELIKLDISLIAGLLNTIDFTDVRFYGKILEYSPALDPLYATVDKQFGGRIVGDGFSFNYAIINRGGGGIKCWGTGEGDDAHFQQNLLGLQKLYATRTAELQDELNTVRHHLPNNEGEPVPTPGRSLSPFR